MKIINQRENHGEIEFLLLFYNDPNDTAIFTADTVMWYKNVTLINWYKTLVNLASSK